LALMFIGLGSLMTAGSYAVPPVNAESLAQMQAVRQPGPLVGGPLEILRHPEEAAQRPSKGL